MTTLGSTFADKPVSSTISNDILNTNVPPAENNHPALREFVSRGKLTKLFEERESLDAEVRKHEGALSPLRRMPVEIISLIFKFAAPFRSYVMNVKEGPWTLSAVCSRWRTIALSQPNLWTDFVLNFVDDRDSPESAGRILPLIEAHLERSQKLPLTIKFFPHDEIECTEAEQALLDLLAAHCDRWETVELYGSTLFYDTLIGSIYGRLPILRKLDIRVCSQFEEDDDQELDISDLFAACPALQEVVINVGPYSGDNPVIADLPCAQLLRYSASNHWPNHVRVLTSAVNLVDCVLRLIQFEQGPAPGSPIVLLPQLRRLSTSTADVLDYLETPVLQELYCCDHSSSLHSYLKRVPSLRRLFVAGTQSAADIGLLLHAALTITNLFLYLPMPFAPDLLALLENPTPPADGQPATLPTLDTLSLCLVPLESGLDRALGGPLDEDNLMRTVEARFQRGSLRSLRLYAMGFVASTATLKRMQALSAQGMQIVLYERANFLYSEMVSPDFQLYRDLFLLTEHYF
ncbi:hypothetical protein DFH08DRAFT_895315 [Mycena albidolilacea]|uniref:F-box domain-containing protein n=1 Tax=Mycena albidolilacea TaxID=1033008 RepID=A0AAD6ZB96_9AGAR|nr:hypothetical protein DFH08DRAFT_895315 [Mycena albidolilacea]